MGTELPAQIGGEEVSASLTCPSCLQAGQQALHPRGKAGAQHFAGGGADRVRAANSLGEGLCSRKDVCTVDLTTGMYEVYRCMTTLL